MPTELLDRPLPPVDDLTHRQLIGAGVAAAGLGRITDQESQAEEAIAEFRDRIVEVAALVASSVDSDVWYQDTAVSRMVRLDDIERLAQRPT